MRWFLLLLILAGPGAAAPPPGGPAPADQPPKANQEIIQVPVDQTVTGASGRTYRVQFNIQITVTEPSVVPPVPPLSISSFAVAPNTVAAGAASTGTILLNRAPEQPVQVTVKADSTALTIPATVSFATGQTTGTFAIGTPKTQAADYWYSLAVGYNGQSRSASLLVKSSVVPPPAVLSMTNFQFLGANPLPAPGATTVGVSLSGVATSDTSVLLTSSDPLAAPDPLVVRAGQSQGSASVRVPAAPATQTTVILTAKLGTDTRTLSLVVLPASVPVGPKITGYTDADGQPIGSNGIWVGTAVNINGSGFGQQAPPGAVGNSVGTVTWKGIALKTNGWNDTQIQATTSMAAFPSGSAPLVVTKYDGTVITGPNLLLQTPITAGPQIEKISRNGGVGEVTGRGFGSLAGQLFVSGYPTPFLTWTDVKITWDLSLDAQRAQTTEAAVRRPDGGYYGLLMPRDTVAVPGVGTHARVQGRRPDRVTGHAED